MARWEPNAAGRLAEAAMALFLERGYGKTTVGDIAARAGLTERTFFNHFADKREVLFSGSESFVERVVAAVRAADRGTAPLDAVVDAYAATGAFFDTIRPFARQRSAIIQSHAELMERELIKLLTLAAAVTAALVERGAAGPAATLAAETGAAIFRVGFEQWIKDPDDRGLDFHVRAARRQLERVVTTSARRRAR